MKIVFMGTPDFAVPSLCKIADSHHEVGYVVTQPDRRGNRNKLVPPPVKVEAEKRGIAVLQPEKLSKDSEAISAIRKYGPDVFVVVAYGQILSEEVLSIPKLGSFNVHASLLPKYRGASPMQQAILNGDDVSGITIMKMDKGLDTGDMVSQKIIEIKDMDMGTVHDLLAEEGAKLMDSALDLIAGGRETYTPQDEEQASYSGKITKKDGKLDFSISATELMQRIRAMSPWPGSFCNMDDKVMKVFDCRAADEESHKAPGTIIDAGKTLKISCGRGALEIGEVQLPGKKRMKVEDYLRGNSIDEGTILT